MSLKLFHNIGKQTYNVSEIRNIGSRRRLFMFFQKNLPNELYIEYASGSVFAPIFYDYYRLKPQEIQLHINKVTKLQKSLQSPNPKSSSERFKLREHGYSDHDVEYLTKKTPETREHGYNEDELTDLKKRFPNTYK
jgi:hypothetical protein